MKLKTNAELTNEELLKREKSVRIMVTFTLFAVIVMLLGGIFITYQKKSFNTFIVLPFCFLPIYINNFMTLKKIREEKAKRNL